MKTPTISILDNWRETYKDMDVQAYTAEDSTPKLIIDMQTGKFIFETTGRPDGLKPYKFDSFWDFLKGKEIEAIDKSVSFVLTKDDVVHLCQEMLLYHIRSLAFARLDRFTESHLDAFRNLQVLNYTHFRKVEEEAMSVLKQVRFLTLKRYYEAVKNRDKNGEAEMSPTREEGQQNTDVVSEKTEAPVS
jgi:hypothetical protein